MTPVLCYALAAMTLIQEHPPVFPAQSDVVRLPVVAVDRRGIPVTDLSSEDFTLFENGQRRAIELFRKAGDAPEDVAFDVDFVLLLDTSTSMLEDLGRARDAAVRFLEELPRGHARGIVAFDGTVMSYGPSAEEARAAIDQVLRSASGGGTRLYDALGDGLKLLSSSRSRKLIVLLTDGEDQGSRRRFDDALALLRASDVTLYVISYARHLKWAGGIVPLPTGPRAPGVGSVVQEDAPERRAQSARLNLVTLAEATGGQVFDAERGGALAAFRSVAAYVGAQYLIGFTPATGGGAARTIKVETRRRGVSLQYRRRYERAAASERR